MEENGASEVRARQGGRRENGRTNEGEGMCNRYVREHCSETLNLPINICRMYVVQTCYVAYVHTTTLLCVIE